MSEPEKPLHVRVAEALSWAGGGPYQPAPSYPGQWFKTDEGPPLLSGFVPRYDTSWSATGPLIERYKIDVGCEWRAEPLWSACVVSPNDTADLLPGYGATPLIAVCDLILKRHAAGKLEARP